MRKKEETIAYNVLKSDEDIVHYLKFNVYKQKHKEFYQGLSTKALEILLSSHLQKNNIGYEDALLVIDLTKKQPFILRIAFDRNDFNFQRMFGFLQQQIVMDKVRALEEMFIPFCKKYPEKVLEMLKANPKIKDNLLSHLYIKQIFRFLFTTVFCLHDEETKGLEDISYQTIHKLVKCVKIYSPFDTNDSPYDAIEVIQNFNEFMEQLLENVNSVFIPFLVNLVSLLDQNYIEELLQLFIKAWKDQELKQYCEAIIEILLNILRVFEHLKLKLNRNPSKEETKMIEEVEQQLLKNAMFLAKKMQFFSSILLEKSKYMHSSSGQLVPVVGMTRYKILELIQKLLSINELCDLQIDFVNFNFFPVIEFYLENHKWNNIAHNIILKIAQLIIQNDYNNFKKRYILNGANFSSNIFGHLVENFRNKKFIFLKSFKMMNNGNLCSIYELSKMLVNEMKQKNDLNFLMKNFKIWKDFMEQDMTFFEKTSYKEFKIEMREATSPSKRKNRSKTYDSTKSIGHDYRQNTRGRTLQTFDEILNTIKQSQKWNSSDISDSPRQTISAKRSFVSRFDSIGYLESQ